MFETTGRWPVDLVARDREFANLTLRIHDFESGLLRYSFLHTEKHIGEAFEILPFLRRATPPEVDSPTNLKRSAELLQELAGLLPLAEWLKTAATLSSLVSMFDNWTKESTTSETAFRRTCHLISLKLLLDS